MLRVIPEVSKMRLFVLLVTIVLLMVSADAESNCDPLTQYALNGECCQMCGPGTSLSSISTCQTPQCQECGRNEYQEKYTKESKCERQPYCDPNRNFKPADQDTKKRSICMCKDGFHCSAHECITCVPHEPCRPGYGVKSEGDHTHDTVCEICPKGTFSENSSWKDVCKKWTECKKGYRIEKNGTDISDNICVEVSRTHLVLAIVIPVVLVLLLVVLLWFGCRNKQGDAKRQVKGCCESCLGEKHEPLKEREGTELITPTFPVDEESTPVEVVSFGDDDYLRRPVEHEDEPSQETEGALTVNGNLVTQENGEADKLSRQESQTQTITDSITAVTQA